MKRNVKYFKHIFLSIIFSICLFGYSYSQVADTTSNIYLKNITYVDCRTIEFEIWVEYTGNVDQLFQFFQAGIDFNYAGLANGGTITGAFVSGSADASLPSSQKAPNWNIDQTSKQIRLRAAIATPSVSATAVPPPPGFRLGKFRMRNTSQDFTNGATPNFVFKFLVGTSTTTQTKIGFYLAGNTTGTDVTHASHQIIEISPPFACGANCPINIAFDQVSPPVCLGGSNGSVQATLSGEGSSSTGTYFLDALPGIPFTTNPFIVSGLSAGVHSIYVRTTIPCLSGIVQFNINPGSDPSDNNLCTIDACNSLTGVTHTQVLIDDNNFCTTDGCDPLTGIFHNSINPDDGNACTIDDCDPSTGIISNTPVNINDNNICTIDECDVLTGIISHNELNVNDNNECTLDLCHPIFGIFHIPANIDDGNVCTNDFCNSLNGNISHSLIDVNDNNVCTTDGCDPVSGIYHTPVNTNDNNVCTFDICDPQLGVFHFTVNFDDENVCTTDGCNSVSGIFHSAVNTDDNNACTIDACDPISGVHHDLININDDDLCTFDACNTLSGEITHSNINTDDNNNCTLDACDSQTGIISHLDATPTIIATAGDILCYGGSTCITVTATGGQPPYSGTDIFCGYGTGTYSFDVTDSKGCSATSSSITISQPEKLTIDLTSTPSSGSDGTATAIPAGGTSPYSYYWTPSGQTTNIITGLPPEFYTVKVTDANGCTSTASNVVAAVCNLNAPGTIIGPNGVCAKQTGLVFCVSNPNPFATAYIWTLPTGAIAQGSSNGSCITLKFSSKFKGGFICVKALTNCGSSASACLNVLLITTKPVTPGNITGLSALCPNTTTVYSIATVPKATSYAWSFNGNLQILSGQGTTTVVIKTLSNFNGGAVKVKAVNCKDFSGSKTKNISKATSCRQSSNTSVIISKSLSGLSAFPNPTTGKFTISFYSEMKSKFIFKVNDMLGNIILIDRSDAVIGENTNDIDLGNISKGVYFLSVEMEGIDRKVVRIVLE